MIREPVLQVYISNYLLVGTHHISNYLLAATHHSSNYLLAGTHRSSNYLLAATHHSTSLSIFNWGAGYPSGQSEAGSLVAAK